MNKPNLMESLEPCSEGYSFKTDLRLNGWLLVAIAMHLGERALHRSYTDWHPAFTLAIALAPLVPGLLYIRSWARFIRGLDELQRRIQLEAFLFAAVGTVMVGATVSILNEHGFSPEWMKHGLGLGASFMVMLVLWTVGWAFAKRRYK